GAGPYPIEPSRLVEQDGGVGRLLRDADREFAESIDEERAWQERDGDATIPDPISPTSKKGAYAVFGVAAAAAVFAIFVADRELTIAGSAAPAGSESGGVPAVVERLPAVPSGSATEEPAELSVIPTEALQSLAPGRNKLPDGSRVRLSEAGTATVRSRGDRT